MDFIVRQAEPKDAESIGQLAKEFSDYLQWLQLFAEEATRLRVKLIVKGNFNYERRNASCTD